MIRTKLSQLLPVFGIRRRGEGSSMKMLTDYFELDQILPTTTIRPRKSSFLILTADIILITNMPGCNLLVAQKFLSR